MASSDPALDEHTAQVRPAPSESARHSGTVGVVASGQGVRIKHFTSRIWRPAGLDFEVRTGEVLVVTGPSGCGKSSLMLTLNGLIPHVLEADLRGTVTVCGQQVQRGSVRHLVREVGVVFQDPDAQLVTTSVLDEVCFGLENLEVPAAEIEPRAREALSAVGLADDRDAVPMHLSGGQRQRLVVACALAMSPRLLVLDEPTAHVDPGSARELLSLIPALRAQGVTVVIVDHDLDRVIEVADRLLVLDRKGRALAHGAPAEVFPGERGRITAEGVRQPIALRTAHALTRAGATGFGYPLTIEQARTAFAEADTSACRSPTAVEWIEPDGDVLLHASDLRVSRGRRLIVPGLSVTVRRGEFTAIIGPNGAGKTTVGLALAGLIRSAGALSFGADGVDPRRLSIRRLSDRVGYVFQNPEHQFVTHTVADEIAYGLRRRRVDDATVAARVEELLERLELTAVRDQHPFLLSGGQQRRLSVATVLVTDPELVILDEPSYGLDDGATASLMDILAELHRAGTSVVMIVHDLALAADHANRALLLRDGTVAADGSAPTILSDDELLAASGLAPLPLRECLSGLRARDPRFEHVYRVDQIDGAAR